MSDFFPYYTSLFVILSSTQSLRFIIVMHNPTHYTHVPYTTKHLVDYNIMLLIHPFNFVILFMYLLVIRNYSLLKLQSPFICSLFNHHTLQMLNNLQVTSYCYNSFWICSIIIIYITYMYIAGVYASRKYGYYSLFTQ